MKLPLITIVTVVYNGSKFIEDTILSVINQDYKNIQYIIIDGGSNDTTIDIINKYKNFIDIFISESDFGIYDAMNKSLLYCKGDWLNYMNVGDIFYNNTVISDIFTNGIKLNTDLIYGNHKVLYKNSIVNKYPSNLDDLWKGMTIQHQSIFLNKNIYKNCLFNTKYRFAADFDLVLRCKKNGYNFFYLNKFICIVSANGFSESNSYSTYLEFKKISLLYDSSLSHKLYFIFKLPFRKIIILLKFYFPFINKIKNFKF
jgi:glycosyltransferase involved in cell wall biosynthesis